MAAMGGGKKSTKKKKGQTLSLNSFLADSPSYQAPAKKLNWAEESDDTHGTVELAEEYGGPPMDLRNLPSAPRASRAVDLDMSRLPSKPPYTAFLGNLPFDVTEDDIRNLFFGLKVDNIRFPQESGRVKGFGYAEFYDIEELKAALALSNEKIRSRQIRIDIADQAGKDQMGRDGGRGGGFDDKTSGDWRNDDGPNDRDDRRDRREDRRSEYGDRERRPAGPADMDDCWRKDDAPSSGRDDSWGGRRDGGGFRDDRGGKSRDGWGGGGGFRDDRGGGFRDDRGGGFRDDRGGGFRDDRGGGGGFRDDRGGAFRDDRGGGGGFRDDRGGGGGFRDDRGGGFRDDRGGGGGFRDDRGGGFRDDRGGGFRDDRSGGFRDDRGGGFRDDRSSGGFRDDRGGGFRDDRGGGFRDDRSSGFRDDRPSGGAHRDDRGGRDERDAPRDKSREDDFQRSDAPVERPKLNLKPRTVDVMPEENAGKSPSPAKSSIFGNAKPVDTATKERQIEEKLNSLSLSGDPKRNDDRDLRGRRDDRPREGSRDRGRGRSREDAPNDGPRDGRREQSRDQEFNRDGLRPRSREPPRNNELGDSHNLNEGHPVRAPNYDNKRDKGHNGDGNFSPDKDQSLKNGDNPASNDNEPINWRNEMKPNIAKEHNGDNTETDNRNDSSKKSGGDGKSSKEALRSPKGKTWSDTPVIPPKYEEPIQPVFSQASRFAALGFSEEEDGSVSSDKEEDVPLEGEQAPLETVG